MKKILLIIFCMIFLVGIVSALQLNPFGKVITQEKSIQKIDNQFLRDNFNEEYGAIEISNTAFWIPSSKVAEYSLISNTLTCSVNCRADGKAILYKDGKLFDEVNFFGIKDILQQLESYQFWIKVNETQEVKVIEGYEKKCVDDEVPNYPKLCYQSPIYKYENQSIEVWKPYNYEELNAGNYEWRLTGQKNPEANIDFRVKKDGQELKQWAWWNGTGGIITYDGAYTVVNFSSNGTFVWAGASSNVSVLVVGGGGGASGGTDYRAGGGAGGYLTNTTYYVSPGSYSVVVGLGGAKGVNGTLSSFGILTAIGGGAGSTGSSKGSLGGSGGGGAYTNLLGGEGTAGQGYAGGNGTVGAGYNSMGGGGGAGALGGNGVQDTNPGNGGVGVSNSISGTTQYYAGGGAGGMQNGFGGGCAGALGGLGGGGNCSNTGNNNAINGTGGGGGGTTDAGHSGGAGGNGIVIIRYLTASSGLSINLVSPENYYNSSSSSVTITVNVTDFGSFGIKNVSSVLNGTINQTNSSHLDGIYTFVLNVPDGFWNQTIIAYDNSSSLSTALNGTLNFTVDTKAPELDSGGSPNGTYNYMYPNYNLTLNFTAIDPHLDTCIWEYNGTNNSIPCTSGVLATSYFNYSKDINSGVLFVNDTFGNLASLDYSFNYKIFENSQTFEASVNVGSLQSFILNLTLGSGIILDGGNFSWGNESDIVPSISSLGSNRILTILNFEIPTYEVDTNVSFYWKIFLSDENINITNRTQLVKVIGLDNCSAFTNELFNISLFDERAKTPLNGTIELDYSVLNKPQYNTLQTFHSKFEGVNTTLICSENNLTGANLAYSAEIKYYATDYASELYNIQRADIDGSSNLSLYDLDSNHSTEFKVIYQDNNYNYVDNAIVQLQRKYLSEGIYEIVEAPLTSADGTAILHIDLDSNKYKATILKDGEVLDFFDNLVFICESPLIGSCTQQLLGKVNPNNVVNLDSLQDFSYTDPTIANQTISLSYAVPSGNPSVIGISMVQKDQFGNTTLCSKNITSSSGSIDCNFTDTIGDSYIDLTLTKDSEIILQKSYIIPADSDFGFLGNNFIIVFLLLLSLVGMAFTSPEWIIVNGIITFLIAGSLWLLNGLTFVVGLGGLMWLLIAAGILIFKLTKQEDR